MKLAAFLRCAGAIRDCLTREKPGKRLDATPSPPFEGKRVRVVLELVDEDLRLSADEQATSWAAWIANGPDGPIEDDGEPEIP